MGYRVAVVGATGNVGREILNILAERQFPLDEIAAVASARSTGDVIDFGDSGEELRVRNLEHFDFSDWDMALFAAGSEVSKIYVPKAAGSGCTVIDNSSLFRMDPDVPLIVPEVNPRRSPATPGRTSSPTQLLDGAAGGRVEAAP
jgi:Aspartate-semialdehyde dehydrogenase